MRLGFHGAKIASHGGSLDDQATYFSVHMGADEIHVETGWHTVSAYATTEEKKWSVRKASLEDRNMWWNMHSAVYKLGEGKDAPTLQLAA